MFQINTSLQHFFLTHLLCIIIYTIVYNYLFNNIEKHYLLSSNITKEEYLDNRWINSLYLSVNMETTTGYVDFTMRSPLAKIIALSQLFISFLVTIGYFHLIMF